MTRGLYTLKREIKETQEHELLYRRDAEMLMPFFIVNCRTLCSSFKSVFVFLGMSWLSPSQLSEVQENFMESKSVYCSLESERWAPTTWSPPPRALAAEGPPEVSCPIGALVPVPGGAGPAALGGPSSPGSVLTDYHVTLKAVQGACSGKDDDSLERSIY